MDTNKLLTVLIKSSQQIATEAVTETNLDMVDVKLKQLKKVNELIYVTIERKSLEDLTKRGIIQ